MAQLTGLSGFGGPIDYMQLVPDFRGEALKTSQANAIDTQTKARQQEMANQQRQDDRQQAFYGAISTATPDQLPALRQQFPEFAQNIQQEIGIQDATHAKFVNDSLGRIQVAYSSGDPQQVQSAIQRAAPALGSIGVQPDQAMQMFQSNPQQFGSLLNASMLSTLPIDKQYDVKQGQQRIDESVRSNKAGEGLQAMQIAQSRENSIRAASAPTSAMQNYNQYAQMLKTNPDGAAQFAQAAGINPASKKLFKVETLPDGSLMKFYSDGTEEAAKSDEPIGQPGMKPITLPAAMNIIDKANEGSKKAAGFALRLKNSMDSMNELSKTVDPKRIALINRSLGDGTIANVSLSPAEQQYMVNARDALYSILRPETGAAITEGEMKEYSKMYLPQPGDSPKATETKMNKMNGQYNSLRGQSGRVYDALLVSSAANNQSVPQQSQQPTQAPADAIKALQSNPALADQFKAKYGYLP